MIPRMPGTWPTLLPWENVCTTITRKPPSVTSGTFFSFKKRLKKEEQTLQQGTLLRQSGHPMGDERHGGSTLPSLTTIGCILWQRELTHRRTGRYTPKGKKYRELPALLPNQTHQVDMVALVILPATISSSACMPSIPQSTGAG